MVYDLVIIGAGVASASALLTLRTCGLKVAVIAPDEKPKFKIGETLSAVGIEELKKLGIHEEFLKQNYWPTYSKFSSWGTSQLKEDYTWKAANQSAGVYLDRMAFEEFLWRSADSIAFDRIDDKVIKADWEEGLWEIRMFNGAQIKSKVLLDCSGRSGIVSRSLDNNRVRHDKLVATYAVLDPKGEEVEPTRATLIESVEDGWFYSVLIPNGKMVVAYFTDSDLLPSGITKENDEWVKLVAQTTYTTRRIETAEYELRTLPKTVDAGTLTTRSFASEHFFAAGDAAASFDPLSSHGITTALWSGRMTAEAIRGLQKNSLIELESYSKAFTRGIDQYLNDQRMIYSQEKRFLESEFWKRRKI